MLTAIPSSSVIFLPDLILLKCMKIASYFTPPSVFSFFLISLVPLNDCEESNSCAESSKVEGKEYILVQFPH